jgi:curli biogenesis system outer membrane secretion channel CsgG
MNHRLLSSLAFFIAAVVAASAAPSDLLKPSAKTKTKDDTTATQMGEYKGVKRALGIADFTSREGFSFEESSKENMRAMLESALFSTNRFVIVERTNLEAVIQEQDLQKSKRAAKADDVAQTGKLRSARYLAACTITEASSSTSGDSGGIAIHGVRLGGSSSKSALVLVVKLIDTTSGEVVASERIRGEAGSSGVSVGLSQHGWGANLSSFAKTPMGQAAQDCINKAVVFIAQKMETTAVEGVVVSVSEQNIIINLGENYGIASGQRFTVRRQGETLTDPSTGEILGKSEGAVVGTLEVTSTRDKLSYCKLADGEMPARGDMVVVK